MLVGDVQTYMRTRGGGIRSDGRRLVIRDPFWNLQYPEQEERRNLVIISGNEYIQH